MLHAISVDIDSTKIIWFRDLFGLLVCKLQIISMAIESTVISRIILCLFCQSRKTKGYSLDDKGKLLNVFRLL
jgi:hypothetical protein